MTELTTYKTTTPAEVSKWIATLPADEFPENGGLNVKVEDLQIAIFNFTRRNEWFATQNLCPHKQQMILSRGMIGSDGDEPKVACPFHKKTFSLKTGENLNGDECPIATYPVKVEGGTVYVGIA
ncbi:MAG: nitrite reductase small subunit NirD [Cytophagales bacterium]|nr:nitrite reductase small subunit NirD [Cytophagales bacterium]